MLQINVNVNNFFFIVLRRTDFIRIFLRVEVKKKKLLVIGSSEANIFPQGVGRPMLFLPWKYRN